MELKEFRGQYYVGLSKCSDSSNEVIRNRFNIPLAQLEITRSRTLYRWMLKNRPFLLGRKFKVFTDHKPLAGFLSNKNPSSKILRWKLALEEFDYDIHHIRGSLNSVADHLSRCINNITIALPESKDLIKMQHEDPVLSSIIQTIDQNDVSPQVSNYFINGEARSLESIHSEYGGHLKFFKTYHRLSENFFWQNMYKDTKNFVRSCTVCLSRKNAFKIPPAPHQPVEQSREPGETCHIDIFGPLKTTPKELWAFIKDTYQVIPLTSTGGQRNPINRYPISWHQLRKTQMTGMSNSRTPC
ncbi:integrase catalytic domain-containing protein [Trichonephila clavipes]|nr:integrase catalytic domain-containing protein [Trichonephila clavipes]